MENNTFYFWETKNPNNCHKVQAQSMGEATQLALTYLKIENLEGYSVGIEAAYLEALSKK